MVTLLVNGRPLAINRLAQQANALAEAWYPGEQGGHAIVDVLFGRINPGGKLPLSFPRPVGELPVYYNPTLRPTKSLPNVLPGRHPHGDSGTVCASAHADSEYCGDMATLIWASSAVSTQASIVLLHALSLGEQDQ